MKTCAAPEKGAINPKPFSSFQDTNFPLSRIPEFPIAAGSVKNSIKVPRAALRNPVRIPNRSLHRDGQKPGSEQAYRSTSLTNTAQPQAWATAIFIDELDACFSSAVLMASFVRFCSDT
jgi:hypothetical protein